jgi:hypothetical protein
MPWLIPPLRRREESEGWCESTAHCNPTDASGRRPMRSGSFAKRKDQILLIDEDQGQSAKQAIGHEGLQALRHLDRRAVGAGRIHTLQGWAVHSGDRLEASWRAPSSFGSGQAPPRRPATGVHDHRNSPAARHRPFEQRLPFKALRRRLPPPASSWEYARRGPQYSSR